MNKELQDLAWSVLPKEFKEEVKVAYKRLTSTKYLQDSFGRGMKAQLETLFGHHNLTSDAEGEEMLAVHRKQVQEMFVNAQKATPSCEYDRGFRGAELTVLRNLFGPKCLTDEEQSAKSAHCLEPKPAEPKFKKLDKVLVKADTAISKDMEIYKKHPSEIKRIDGETALIGMLPKVMICDMQVRLSNLEPYIEPTSKKIGNPDISDLDKSASTCTNGCPSQCKSASASNPNPETGRSLRKSDEDSESEALLNHFPETTKMAIQPGTTEPTYIMSPRLRIAAMAMQGMLANEGISCFTDVQELEHMDFITYHAFEYADKLIKKMEEDEKLAEL